MDIIPRSSVSSNPKKRIFQIAPLLTYDEAIGEYTQYLNAYYIHPPPFLKSVKSLQQTLYRVF